MPARSKTRYLKQERFTSPTVYAGTSHAGIYPTRQTIYSYSQAKKIAQSLSP